MLVKIKNQVIVDDEIKFSNEILVTLHDICDLKIPNESGYYYFFGFSNDDIEFFNYHNLSSVFPSFPSLIHLAHEDDTYSNFLTDTPYYFHLEDKQLLYFKEITEKIVKEKWDLTKIIYNKETDSYFYGDFEIKC